MAGYRVTERSIATNVLMGLQGNLSRLGNIQERLSSGKQVAQPSDSPTAAVAIMQYRGELATAQQHSRNAEDALGWLGTVDTAVSSMISQVQRVRQLVLTGMSNGVGGSADARAALAAEVDQLRSSTMGIANTKYLDRPVFGGTTAGAQALDATSGNYVGDTGTVMRTVGDNVKVTVAESGSTFFGTGANQLFTVLADLSANLNSNPAALSGDLNRLDAAFRTLQTAQSTVGARYNQVEQMQQAANDRVDALTAQLSDVEDIDLPKTISDMSLQQAAYQAALGAAAKVVQPSLVDFLR
ncbi:flagellar hook-associated protein 3 [Planosporangium flavigriseum]|uniref:Flagellar hook-associated protein FlgL n=1 Tax=Planosporangium flavigriseum TaxID=373681 RepID=A0A8J3PQI7_9ACTN|nr:flagellar hook-associated protein FlgL [Planosporangium flavigriseum]NJC67221.1 flagellar hook-associated protein 3 [Planosporangium flavigriseum]GIG76151.1 flagellar hook-associated protein FlgL [Planosporangium flavigriseum]